MESEILKALSLLLIGAFLKFAFDRWGAQLGWDREARKATDGKIERVDSHARAELARIEREVGNRLNAVERSVDVLAERVENLPTADDFRALDRQVDGIAREVSGVTAKVEGIGVTVKTILDHIIAGERKS